MTGLVVTIVVIAAAIAAVIWVDVWLHKGHDDVDDALDTCLTRRGSAL